MAETGIEPATFGLWARRATPALLGYRYGATHFPLTKHTTPPGSHNTRHTRSGSTFGSVTAVHADIMTEIEPTVASRRCFPVILGISDPVCRCSVAIQATVFRQILGFFRDHQIPRYHDFGGPRPLLTSDTTRPVAPIEGGAP